MSRACSARSRSATPSTTRWVMAVSSRVVVPLPYPGDAAPHPGACQETANARGRRGRGREVTDDGGGSDVEAEHPQLVPAVLGDLVRPPRRHPDPVDLDLAVELL